MSVRDKTAFSLKIILVLTLIHLTGDLYHSFFIPLLPLLVDKFSLSLAQAGLITGVIQILAFVAQPPVGYLADRYRTRFFILGGLVLTVVFMSLIGAVTSFWLVLCCVGLGSIGAAMFHPQTAGMVTPFAGRRAGFGMSLFGLGGMIGFGVGPLAAAFWVSRYGLEALPYAVVFGLAVVAFLFFVTPRPVGEGLKGAGLIDTLRETLGGNWRPIALICVLAVLADFVIVAFTTFMPIHMNRIGYSLIDVGLFFAIFSVGGAMGSLLAGHLSDRIGYKPIYYVSFGLATPGLLLLLYLPGRWVFVGAFLSGFFVLATMFVAIVMAQKLAPQGRSMVASLIQGLAYGIAGILAPLTGMVADYLTIQPVLVGAALVPLLSLVLVRRLPRVEGR